MSCTFHIRFLLICSSFELYEPALVHFSRNALAGKKEITFVIQLALNCFSYLLKRGCFCNHNSVPNEETSKLLFIFPETSKYLMAKVKQSLYNQKFAQL